MKEFGASLEDAHPFIHGLKFFGFRFLQRFSERHLCHQFPGFRQLPFPADGVIDERVVVLQGGAESGILEKRLYGQLVHGGGVLRPYGEFVLVGGEGFLQSLYDGTLFEEEHGAVSGGE